MSFLQVTAKDRYDREADQLIRMTEDTVAQCKSMYMAGNLFFQNKTVEECNQILERLDIMKQGLSGEIFTLHRTFGQFLESMGVTAQVSFPYEYTVDSYGQVRAVPPSEE
jgi:hypothetical protein